MDPDETGEPRSPHVLADLDITTEQVSATCCISVAPIGDGVRNCAGGASLGFLATLVDVNCALVALIAADPDWTATADLTLHGVEPLTVGPAVVESRLLRAGRNLIAVSVDVSDGRAVDPLSGEARREGELARGAFVTAARGLVTFARIPGDASSASGSFDPMEAVGRRRRLSPVAGIPRVGLAERIGLRVRDAPRGVVEVPITEYVRNSFGAINGGVLGMMLQGAAEAALAGFAARDLQVHYLAQAREGPASTTATVLRRAEDHAVCAVEIVDAGDGDALLAVATVTLQRAR